MLDQDLAVIQADVRAIAAKELIDRKVAADLFFRTEILPKNLQQQRAKASESLKPFVGLLFGRSYDEMISSELRNGFPMGLKHIADKLEALSQVQHCAIEGDETGARRNIMPASATTKKTKVEECFVLDVDQLKKCGILLSHFPSSGLMVLFKTLTGAPLLSKWEINRSDCFSNLSLTYLAPGSEEVVTSCMEIWRSKRSHKPGTGHAWLTGPHKDDEARKFLKSRRLYLPPGTQRFACNQMYDLDYHRSKSMAGLDLSVPFFFQSPLIRCAKVYGLGRRVVG
ncbi:MAG: hypothetical protein ACYDHG_11175 [Desulfomonilaceae bacterium]